MLAVEKEEKLIRGYNAEGVINRKLYKKTFYVSWTLKNKLEFNNFFHLIAKARFHIISKGKNFFNLCFKCKKYMAKSKRFWVRQILMERYWKENLTS